MTEERKSYRKKVWIVSIIIIMFVISFSMQSVCSQALIGKQFLSVEEVVPGGTIGEYFTHGKFPSLGERTHPGVDIKAEKGALLKA